MNNQITDLAFAGKCSERGVSGPSAAASLASKPLMREHVEQCHGIKARAGSLQKVPSIDDGFKSSAVGTVVCLHDLDQSM